MTRRRYAVMHWVGALFSFSSPPTLNPKQKRTLFRTSHRLIFWKNRDVDSRYSAGRKDVVKGCVSRGFNHATFDHVFGQQSTSRRTHKSA